MIREVSPDEAKRLVDEEGYVYLDVRTPAEFVQGHPQGAVLIPAFLPVHGSLAPNPQFVATVRKHFPQETKFVVGCRSGGRSAKACEWLHLEGYHTAINVAGGFYGAQNPYTGEMIPGWVTLGLPSESGGEALS